MPSAMRVVWTRIARRDANAIFEYLVERNPQAAEAIATALLSAVEKLADHPRLGRPGRVDDTRELVITHYPYIVIYTLKGQRVTILRVRHTAQQWPEEPVVSDRTDE